jgi:hypothetical protein
MEIPMSAERRGRIAALNDQLRQHHTGGRIFMTAGLLTLGPTAVLDAMAAIAEFDAFTDQNDPYDEHDFGSVEIVGERIFWKIDYYDPTMKAGAQDPADAKTCTRVMTVMLAEEY